MAVTEAGVQVGEWVRSRGKRANLACTCSYKAHPETASMSLSQRTNRSWKKGGALSVPDPLIKPLLVSLSFRALVLVPITPHLPLLLPPCVTQMRTRPPDPSSPATLLHGTYRWVLPVTPGPSVTLLPLYLVVFKSFLVMPWAPFPQPLGTSRPGQMSRENSAPLISRLGPPGSAGGSSEDRWGAWTPEQ